MKPTGANFFIEGTSAVPYYVSRKLPLPTAPGPLPEERTSLYWVAKPFGAVEPRYRLYVQSFQE
jgi:hypothetical protein